MFSRIPILLVALAASAATAVAADVTITDARIAGGKLVVTGKTTANSWVRLEGQEGSEFNVKAGADRTFASSVVYHPGDCIVGVQKVTSPASLGAETEAVVEGCTKLESFDVSQCKNLTRWLENGGIERCTRRLRRNMA